MGRRNRHAADSCHLHCHKVAVSKFGGRAMANQITGNEEDNTLNGSSAEDLILGRQGKDKLFGNASNDELRPDDYFIIGGTPTNPVFFTDRDDQEGDELDGGGGIDLAVLGFYKSKIALNLDFRNATVKQTTTYGTTIVNVERVDILGSQVADVIHGGNYDDVLNGFFGNDELFGEGGDDKIVSEVNGGADKIDGGLGLDYAEINRTALNIGGTYNFSDPNAVVTLADGTTITGVERFKLSTGGGIDDITGGIHDDVFEGGLGDDIIRGGNGNDTIRGQGGADRLFGDDGDDDFDGEDYDVGGGSVDGGDGIDHITLDYRSYSANVVFSFSNPASLQILLGGSTMINVERVTIRTGDGDDYLIGGAYDDSFMSGVGDDELRGGGGDDFLSGDDGAFADDTPGQDKLYGDAGDDFLSGGFGNDLLYGGSDDDSLSGDKGIDYVYGEGGDDTFHLDTFLFQNSFGDSDDYIDGGDGIDHADISNAPTTVGMNYDFSNPNQLITFADGSTMIRVERVSFNAGGGDDTLTGGAYADTLVGYSGHDRLDGGGGNDVLVGGTGDDRYWVDSKLDVVREDTDVGGGIDFVFSNVSYTLTNYVERLFLLGTASSATGNAKDNYITGQMGSAINNVIDGGLGADAMYGYEGNDQYFVDNIGDSVNESAAASGGYDKVYSTAETYFLAAGVEDLRLQDNARQGYGNSSNNKIVGNAKDNFLSGGAAGNDTDILEGQGGNDVYYVYNEQDVVREAKSGGHDSIYSYFTIKALVANVENASLDNKQAKNLNLTGNTLDNTLWGNDSANKLYGLTGDDHLYGFGGQDQMWGGAGADRFNFHAEKDSVPSIGKADIIQDFNRGDKDKIALYAIDPVPGGTDQSLSFNTTGKFSGKRGEVIVVEKGDDCVIQINLDNDITAEMSIYMFNEQTMLKGDFML